jgi:hypothetical protein
MGMGLDVGNGEGSAGLARADDHRGTDHFLPYSGLAFETVTLTHHYAPPPAR